MKYVKLILGIFFMAILTVLALLNLAKPQIPEIDSFPNFNAGTHCLYKIPQKYNPDFFTLKGWIKIWITNQIYNWGFKPPTNLSNFYEKYVELQVDVECYLMLSNNPNFNMTLTPSEFVTTYNKIAKSNGLALIR